MPGITTSNRAIAPMTALLDTDLSLSNFWSLSPIAATAMLIQMENAKKLPT